MAAKALPRLISNAVAVKAVPKLRDGWSRFIASLMMRNPEMLARNLHADYAEHRKPTDPATYEEYCAIRFPNPAGRGGAILLQKIIDNPDLGNRINNMRWKVIEAYNPMIPLLTSDRPVLITNGLAYERSQLLLPISPRHVFIATNTPDVERYIQLLFVKDDLFHKINERVALQSHKYVYGFDDAQFDFVAPRLGQKYTATPVEEMKLPLPSITVVLLPLSARAERPLGELYARVTMR
jgi:hypothetical protein